VLPLFSDNTKLMNDFEKRQALWLILDFVERHNKQDRERDVAEAARLISEQLNSSIL
jgi:hypothetical protein